MKWLYLTRDSLEGILNHEINAWLRPPERRSTEYGVFWSDSWDPSRAPTFYFRVGDADVYNLPITFPDTDIECVRMPCPSRWIKKP